MNDELFDPGDVERFGLGPEELSPVQVDLQVLLQRGWARLSYRQRQLMTLRFGPDLSSRKPVKRSLEEIAAKTGSTRERVRALLQESQELVELSHPELAGYFAGT